MYLTMAIGMEQLQIGRSVILVVVVLMMQFDVLITLNHLPADWAQPVLLLQELSIKR
jgi:hypothetical protein